MDVDALELDLVETPEVDLGGRRGGALAPEGPELGGIVEDAIVGHGVGDHRHLRRRRTFLGPVVRKGVSGEIRANRESQEHVAHHHHSGFWVLLTTRARRRENTFEC